MLSTHPWSSSALPIVAEPATPGGEHSAAALTSWLREHAGWLPERLLEAGAVLFRGFGFKTATDFQAFTQARSQGLQAYVGGDSPRTKVMSGVYTSTEYPPDQPIALHSEMSYLPRWPSRLFFFCETAPARGGETPIADCRRLLARIDPDVRRDLTERRIMYVQNLHGGRGLGKSWQQVFETTDRGEVERFCAEQGIGFEVEGERRAQDAPRPSGDGAAPAHGRRGLVQPGGSMAHFRPRSRRAQDAPQEDPGDRSPQECLLRRRRRDPRRLDG